MQTVEFGTRQLRRFRWRRGYTISLAIVASLAVVFVILWGRFGWTSVCADCGCTVESVKWQVPFTDITYWESTSAPVPTKMTAFLEEARLIQPGHHHHLLFIAGSGNGAMCAIGSGRHIVGAVESADTIAFLNAVQKFRGKDDVDRCVAIFLDPDRSRGAMMILEAAPLPPGNFADRAAFDQWTQANKNAFSAASTEVDLSFILR